MTTPDIRDRLFIVMAHPDDEVLWACSLLPAAERIVLVFGELLCGPELTAGRRIAMAEFPLPTLDWLEMTEAGVFDSASWPNPRETTFGLYPHPALRVMTSFDPERYRAQFGLMQDKLRSHLLGARNVVVHSPWGEYGHEDHVQLFRAVAGLADEMRFRVWVPGYYAEKSEPLMRRNLRHFGEPTAPLQIDKALAAKISQIYKRTNTWTWFDEYVWPDSERFLPYLPAGAPADQLIGPDRLRRIVFPAEYEVLRRSRLKWRRESVRSLLSWMNGRRAE